MRYTPYRLPKKPISQVLLDDIVIGMIFIYLAVGVGLVAHFIIKAL
jgi:hypothetical protein